MVCNDTLVRVYRDGCGIEIKKDLSQFEDRFYDFVPLDFPGLPIIVSNFMTYGLANSD